MKLFYKLDYFLTLLKSKRNLDIIDSYKFQLYTFEDQISNFPWQLEELQTWLLTYLLFIHCNWLYYTN